MWKVDAVAVMASYTSGLSRFRREVLPSDSRVDLLREGLEFELMQTSATVMEYSSKRRVVMVTHEKPSSEAQQRIAISGPGCQASE